MDLFLLLTALLCGLTGVNRPTAAPAPTVEASRLIAVVEQVARPVVRAVAPRPSGYVPPAPLVLDLTMARRFHLAIVPERRRE